MVWLHVVEWCNYFSPSTQSSPKKNETAFDEIVINVILIGAFRIVVSHETRSKSRKRFIEYERALNANKSARNFFPEHHNFLYPSKPMIIILRHRQAIVTRLMTQAKKQKQNIQIIYSKRSCATTPCLYLLSYE